MFFMNESVEKTKARLRSLIACKGENIQPKDLLTPEIKLLIEATALTEVDKRFAYYRYVDGLSQNSVMDKMDWYSTSTFTMHNKKVWARLIQTLKILAD